MQKHKWLIEDAVHGAEIGYRAIVDADGYTICNPSPMGESNARLIAAAPSLLASLEACVWQIEQMRGMFDESDGTIQEALDGAYEAIRMAVEGKA
jgi:hypothetical protein